MIESDDWSDSEDEDKGAKKSSSGPGHQKNEVEQLKAELEARNAQISQLQLRVHDILDEVPSVPSTSASTVQPPRDDDSHYFESYGYQGRAFPLILYTGSLTNLLI